MQTWLTRLFSPLLALLLIVSSTMLAAYLVPRSAGTPIYQILNNNAATMKTKEFLRLAAVNLNTADKTQLMAIPSIGEKLAERIIAYREINGSFVNLEDLDKIKGIGAKTVRLLGEYAYVD